jgi:signal transduction histidine kinase
MSPAGLACVLVSGIIGASTVRRPTLPVFALPAALVVIQLVFTQFAAQNQPERRGLDLLAYVLLAAGPVALLARRRHPVPVLLAVVTVTLTYLGLGYPYGPVFASLVAAFVGTVLAGHRRASWAIAVVAVAVHAALLYVQGEPLTWGYIAGVLAWLTVALALAEVIRVRRERAADVARTRAEEARRRAGEERLQIARELHDVLAHHISLINIQAGVALHLMESNPDQVRQALTTIKQESRDVLHELRSALEVLRGSHESAPRTPTPGMDRLDELVERSQAAGLAVRTQVDGAPRALPARVDTAAFRIVQEALTNVYRHARAANATVVVGYGERDLTVQIDDDGTGGPSNLPGTGSGLAGMRERATALGGSLDAGRRPDGGFRVLARLPLDTAG